MTLGIVSRDINSVETQRFVNIAKDMGIDAYSIYVDGAAATEEINSSEHIIIRIGPKSYATYRTLLPNIKVEHRRQIQHALDTFNKARAVEILSNAKVPIPHTDVVDPGNIRTLQSFPKVIKKAVGYQGEGVYLVKNSAQAIGLSNQLAAEDQVLIQECITESLGKDKRILISGGRLLAAMIRTAPPGDFRSNIGVGGIGIPYAPTDLEVSIALEAVKAHGLEYGGVDIIDSKRGPLVLEVNSSPGIAIEAITRIEVVPEIIRNIVKED